VEAVTITRVKTIDIDTPHGPGKAHVHVAEGARAALVLGHGAGGGVEAPDLAVALQAALEERISVALFEQPYKVAGRRSPAPARQLDAAWTAAFAQLREGELAGLPVIAGGRSLGARVACRTSEEVGAIGVLCLAFPLHAPGRGGDPKASRIEELDGVKVPTLVVQGERDPFGMPPSGRNRTVVTVAGDHGLKADLDAVAAAIRGWLPNVGR
jgi:predicted alpha/beta-hydrolase family hydrolase